MTDLDLKHRVKFAKHSTCESHLKAVAALTGCSACEEAARNSTDARDAPSVAEFEQKIKALRQSGKQGKIDGVCEHRSAKGPQLDFCTAEAMRCQDREHLRSCNHFVSHTDGKKKRLTMQFVATNSDLVYRKGHLGHVDHVGGPDSVESYVASIRLLLEQFCTFGHGAPGRQTKAPLTEFDDELFQHMLNIHEVWDADAARVMTLTGMELSNHGNLRPDGALFSSNKMARKDPTHAARRMLQRPHLADQVLQD